VQDGDGRDGAAGDVLGEAPPDGLDLGQLRHVAASAGDVRLATGMSTGGTGTPSTGTPSTGRRRPDRVDRHVLRAQRPPRRRGRLLLGLLLAAPGALAVRLRPTRAVAVKLLRWSGPLSATT
jgi:hypothetical protein